MLETSGGECSSNGVTDALNVGSFVRTDTRDVDSSSIIDAPNTENIYQSDRLEQLDDARFILLLNTVSQAQTIQPAGTIPDNAEVITEKFLDRLIKSYNTPSHVSNA